MTLLTEMGFSKIVNRVSFLSITGLMSELSPYSQIASFHFFSHGSPMTVFLDRIGVDTDLRWFTEAPESKKLTGHFTKDAYAVFYSYNGGHAHAPGLKNLWNIPVAGALTGTHLEMLSSDNKFYWADKKGQSVRSRCKSSDCYRFRPDNSVYDGMWGTFQQGLPLFKFFCPNELDEQ